MNDRETLISLRGTCSPSFIAAADIHLGHKLYNFPELEEDHIYNFVKLCDLAIEKKVEYLVIAGDLFEDNKQDAATISLVKAQVIRLAEQGTKVLGIAGDHDKPIDGASWCNVSGITPVTNCPYFAGMDYYDYSSGMDNVMTQLRHQVDKEKIKWIFLHCQFPALFKFAEAKKTIDFSQIKIFNDFPNLEGIIAGDIHAYDEGTISDVELKLEAYIGYCGSLGINDIAESYKPRSVLYCDGTKLVRLIFPQRREYIKIDFTSKGYQDFNPEDYIKKYKDYKIKPVFYVTYDGDSDPYITRIRPLYSLGFVAKSQKIRTKDQTEEAEMPDIRNEIKTDANIELALKECCGSNSSVYTLILNMLDAPDPKQHLDKFRTSVTI